MPREKIHNELMPARRKRGLSRKQVAGLLGYKSPSTVARLERGVLIPSLRIVLQLELLYRTPIGYLYPQLYTRLRDELREKESALPNYGEPEANLEESSNA